MTTQNNFPVTARPGRRHRPLLWGTLCLCLLLAGCGSGRQIPNLGDPKFLYAEAQRAMNQGAYDVAVQIYEQLAIRHPFSPEARQAKLDLIYVYHRADAPEQAIDAADNFIIENPRDPNVDYAYYLRGLVYFESGRNFLEKLFRVDINERPPNDAYRSFSYFQLLLQRFPDSAYAEDARERMLFLRNRLAAYEVFVAEYYIERGAYVGAANRAKYVLENYPDAPATEDALAVLGQAYDKLGLDSLSEDTRRVLVATYGSEALEEGRRGLFPRIFRRRQPEPGIDEAKAAVTN
jgi:outer membrane protein assembly factor BamD